MRTAPLLTTCLALLLALGCGGSPAPQPYVQGRVYYKGQPLAGGTVVFAPDPTRGGHGPMAWGQIDADGRYRLTTDGRNGASPGWHRITVAGGTGGQLPACYRDPELSGQRFEVRPDRTNVCDLHLE